MDPDTCTPQLSKTGLCWSRATDAPPTTAWDSGVIHTCDIGWPAALCDHFGMLQVITGMYFGDVALNVTEHRRTLYTNADFSVVGPVDLPPG